MRFYFYFCFIETNSKFVQGLGLEGQTTIFCFVSFGLVFCSVIYYILTTVLPPSTPPGSPTPSTPLKIHSSSIFFQKRIGLPGISTGHGIQATKRWGIALISYYLLRWINANTHERKYLWQQFCSFSDSFCKRIFLSAFLNLKKKRQYHINY